MTADNPAITAESLELGARIKYRREATGLTQRQLAEAIGASEPSVSNWERGINTPNRENLRRIAVVLDTSELVLRFGPQRPAPGMIVREGHKNTMGSPKLSPRAYERVYGFLEVMRVSGMPEEAVDEAERYLVEPNFGKINKRDYRERSDDEVITDIDAMWQALRVRFERDWGVRL